MLLNPSRGGRAQLTPQRLPAALHFSIAGPAQPESFRGDGGNKLWLQGFVVATPADFPQSTRQRHAEGVALRVVCPELQVVLQQPLRDDSRQLLRSISASQTCKTRRGSIPHLSVCIQQRARDRAQHRSGHRAARGHRAGPLEADRDPEVADADAGVGADTAGQRLPSARRQRRSIFLGDQRHQVPQQLHRLAVARIRDPRGLKFFALFCGCFLDVELVILKLAILHHRQGHQEWRD
mmetsp:Transcript_53100/g.172639  ORF Transcript_53100/g.172639 Transcript_53100/m.172639 type:complete len:237 (+) Transcript_53100:1171-1881(+)